MLPKKSSGWEQLRSGENKENVPIDYTNSYTPLSTSFASIWRPLPELDLSNCNKTFNITKEVPKLGSEQLESPCSSGYGSITPTHSPNIDFKIHQDELSASFDSLLEPLTNCKITREELIALDLSSFPYSPLSSFSSFNSSRQRMSGFPDLQLFDVTPAASILQEENKVYLEHLQKDFDSNGQTSELEATFTPPVSSTPLNARRPIRGARDSFVNQAYTRSASRNNKPKKKFKPDKASLLDHCVFCKNNGHSEYQYKSHTVKDAYGKVICPRLRLYKCPICSVNGDKAHTIKYCPMKPIITLEDTEKGKLPKFY